MFHNIPDFFVLAFPFPFAGAGFGSSNASKESAFPSSFPSLNSGSDMRG